MLFFLVFCITFSKFVKKKSLFFKKLDKCRLRNMKMRVKTHWVNQLFLYITMSKARDDLPITTK